MDLNFVVVLGGSPRGKQESSEENKNRAGRGQ
jgi:hypothetical protein